MIQKAGAPWSVRMLAGARARIGGLIRAIASLPSMLLGVSVVSDVGLETGGHVPGSWALLLLARRGAPFLHGNAQVHDGRHNLARHNGAVMASLTLKKPHLLVVMSKLY